MRIILDQADIDALPDSALRALIVQRLAERELEESFDAELHGPFVVMEPGDALTTVEAAAGTPLLRNPVTDVEYGDPSFSPIFEYVGAHAHYYELVLVPGGGDDGVTVFVPRHPAIEPRLLQLCAEYAVPEPARL